MRAHRIEIFWNVLLVGIIGCGARVRAATAAGAMRKGLEQVEAEEYLPAATNFVQAAELAAGQERSPALAWFNAGNAYYRSEQFDDARASYMRALNTEDLSLQARVFHNLGNLDLKASQIALKERRAAEAVELYDQAAANYEKAIALAPDYIDPKYNYELSGQRRYQLLATVDQARADIERARRMAQAGEYAQAAASLQEKAPDHELAFQIEPDLKQVYEELSQRIGQIAAIVGNVEGGENVQP